MWRRGGVLVIALGRASLPALTKRFETSFMCALRPHTSSYKLPKAYACLFASVLPTLAGFVGESAAVARTRLLGRSCLILKPKDNTVTATKTATLGLEPGIQSPVIHHSEAYIGLSMSADGVSWRPWTRVLKSERDVDLGAKKFRYRSLDQPVCGLLRREGRATLYVQREVAGIYSPSQDCCNKPRTRLEAVDVTRWVA